jgi:hypothetical protein
VSRACRLLTGLFRLRSWPPHDVDQIDQKAGTHASASKEPKGVPAEGPAAVQSSVEGNEAPPDSTRNRRPYRSNVHWPLVIALLVIVFLSGLVGWLLHPQDSPPTVGEENLQFNLSLSPVPTQLRINETVSMTAAPYHLRFLDFGFSGNAPGPRAFSAFTRWTLFLPNFSGELCHDPGMHITKTQAHLTGTQSIPTLQGAIYNGPPGNAIGQTIELCWTHNPPALVSGPYLAATFPLVSAGRASPYDNATVSTSNSLQFSDLGLGSYTLESGPSPTNITADDWQWDTKIPINGDTGPNVIYATNIFELQRDNRNAFLSGIVLGLAGAALIALVQELLSAVRRGRIE